MSKRQFLEEMVQLIIENNVESAREKFHQYVVESAREIHASLIENDELEDDIDETTVEESFEEVVEADSDETEDFGSDIDQDGGEDVDMGGEEMEIGGEEAPAEEETVEVSIENIDDIKAQLAELQAKFDALNGSTEEMPVDGEVEVVDTEVEEPTMEDMDSDVDSMEDMGEMDEGFDLTEEDLLGLEEGWTEVKVSMDGGEQGGGKFAGSEKNTKTPVAVKSDAQVDPKDLVSKQDAHKGYAKEQAPAAPMKSDSENVMTSGKKAWTDVNAKMDGGEQGGGKFATPEKSKTTPVAKN